MIKQIDSPEHLAPWYVNQTLTPRENESYEMWLEKHPEAKADLGVWQDLKRSVSGQTRLVPPPFVFDDTRARIDKYGSSANAGRLILPAIFSGIAVSLVVFVFLWLVVKPGITLRWSVNGVVPASFRIYRAPAGGEAYTLVGEILAQENQLVYQYSDLFFIPGQSYRYRVEAISSSGEIAFSQAVANDPRSILPGQLGILLTSLIMGYVGLSLLKYLPGFLPKHSDGVLA